MHHHEYRGRGIRWKSRITRRNPARHLDVYGLIVKVLRGDQGVDALAPLVHLQGIAQTNTLQAGLQAAQVLPDAERFARIHRDEFIHAVAKHKPAIQHRDARLGQRHIHAI